MLTARAILTACGLGELHALVISRDILEGKAGGAESVPIPFKKLIPSKGGLTAEANGTWRQ